MAESSRHDAPALQANAGSEQQGVARSWLRFGIGRAWLRMWQRRALRRADAPAVSDFGRGRVSHEIEKPFWRG